MSEALAIEPEGDVFCLFNADSSELLKTFPDQFFDSLVTDPPAGIGFMGKTWDRPGSYGFTDGGDRLGSPPALNLGRNPTCANCGGRKRAGPATKSCSCAEPKWNDLDLRLRDREAFIASFQPIFAECLRVLKPGAHGLVWALPRTSHWTATALEDAGFEIRDVVMHLFGTGFPKSLNLPNGIGTALKPAAEHWILVRKPLIGTVAENVLAHGTGGLNIDASRIGFKSEADKKAALPGSLPKASSSIGTFKTRDRTAELPEAHQSNLGRWPANVTLDEEAAALLDEQSGMLSTRGNVGPSEASKIDSPVFYGPAIRHSGAEYNYEGSGGASRFFYVAKPSRSERDAGCEDLPPRSAGEATDREEGTDGLNSPRAGAGRTGGAKNIHPTVKSSALMDYLIKLITPAGGNVLDPFMGSGSTGIAAVKGGWSFVGIEREAEYFEIAKRRIRRALNG